MAGTSTRRAKARPKQGNGSKRDIEAILADVEAPEGSVTLCLRASLVAEYEELAEQLERLTSNPINLAGDSAGGDIAKRMEQLHDEMVEHEQVFRLRAVTPRGEWRRLLGKRPVKTAEIDDDEHADAAHAWLCTVVARSAIDPAMTPEQVERLADKLSEGQWAKLAGKAWNVNDDAAGIPFSVAASVLSRSSGEKSKPQEPSTNPARGSLAGSPPSDSSTTTTDD
jgi:hypothetical protein